jgi:hypothetical protein
MADNEKRTLQMQSGDYESAKAVPLEAALVRAGPSVDIEDDSYGWLLDQATALRNRNTRKLDWEHLAEELEAMAASDRSELTTRLATLFEHLLKLQYEPNEVPTRGRGWVIAVIKTRQGVRNLLETRPSLKARLEESAAKAYPDAVKVVGPYVAKLPDESPWTLDEAMNPDYFPNEDLVPRPV